MVGTFVNECLNCNRAHLLTRIDSLKAWLRECEDGCDIEETAEVDFEWDEEMLAENEVNWDNRSIFTLKLDEWRAIFDRFKKW